MIYEQIGGTQFFPYQLECTRNLFWIGQITGHRERRTGPVLVIYLMRELLKVFSRTRQQRNFATFLDETARQRGTETGSDTRYDGYPNIGI